VVVAMLGVGFSLRTLMAALPPLVGEIRTDLGLGAVGIGILTTIPVLAMGLFAPVAARLSHQHGAGRVVTVAAVLVVLGNLLRGLPEVVPVFAGTLVAGVGIALAGALTPGLVKGLFPPRRAGLATGLNMLSMMSGAAIASAVSVPLAGALGGWATSLAIWGVVALVGLVLWLPLARELAHRRRTADHPDDASHGLPWRSATALLVACYLAAQSWQFYSALAWLSPTYVDHGWTPAGAGLLLSVFTGAQFVSGLVAPALADHVPDIRVLLYGACASGLAGELGVWLAPAAAPWVWAGVLGIGQGSEFGLGLVLLVRYAVSPRASARFTAMAFFVSYGLASLGPTAMGAVRDATDGFRAVWLGLALVMVVQVVSATRLRPDRAKVA
jgi:cyanate permease